MNEQQQADALRRWLDAGGKGAPPSGLDPEVLEAIYAMRPELAPAPRVSIDDILAGVTSGPFAHRGAASDEEGAEVVPFPVSASMPEAGLDVHTLPTPANRPRWRGLSAGLVGLAAAAAAAVLVFAPQQGPGVGGQADSEASGSLADYASRRSGERTAAPPAASAPMLPAAKALPSKVAQTAADDNDAVAMENAPAEPELDLPYREPRADKASARGADAGFGAAEPDDARIAEAEQEAGLTTQTAIPKGSEVGERLQALGYADDDDGVASGGAVGAAPPAPPPVVASSPEPEVVEEAALARNTYEVPASKDERRTAPATRAKKEAAAESADAPADLELVAPASGASSWRQRVDADTVTAVDAALDQANERATRDPRGAAMSLEPFIRAPVAAGQAVALEAVGHALRAGDLELARRLAAKGTTLDPQTPAADRLRALVASTP